MQKEKYKGPILKRVPLDTVNCHHALPPPPPTIHTCKQVLYSCPYVLDHPVSLPYLYNGLYTVPHSGIYELIFYGSCICDLKGVFRDSVALKLWVLLGQNIQLKRGKNHCRLMRDLLSQECRLHTAHWNPLHHSACHLILRHSVFHHIHYTCHSILI